MGNRDSKAYLDENCLAMYALGSWVVPSYRLLDENGGSMLALSGPDRL